MTDFYSQNRCVCSTRSHGPLLCAFCLSFHFNTQRAHVDAITAIHSGELMALMWFERLQTKPTANAFRSWRQIFCHNKVSTVFTKIGVQKSVFARRSIGLDRFKWIINQLGILD